MNKLEYKYTSYYNFTNNYWINNGLAVLLSQSKRERTLKYEMDGNGITLKTDENDIHDILVDILYKLASNGTFNFSSSFKIINAKLHKSYTKPKEYPTTPEELNKFIEIGKDDKSVLKKRGVDTKTKQKIWKTRLSYLNLSDKNNYFKYGLNFKEQNEYKSLTDLRSGDKQCIFCGCSTKSLIELKESHNPFLAEHHNNVIDGISAQQSGREKLKCCPKCFLFSQLSVFNPYIPFYNDGKKTVYAIPNSSNIELLVKVQNNLSTPGQFIDFNAPDCTSYATNIKDLPRECPEAGLLALLHNIKNRYMKDESDDLGFFFDELTKEELIEIREWSFVGNTITHIKAEERIFDFLEPILTDKGQMFLVSDALHWFPKKYFDENETRKFFRGILAINIKNLSDSLFSFAKMTGKKSYGYNISFENFKKYFLDEILKEAAMLDESIRTACKNIAETVGRSFSKDVGMITKFAYASSAAQFKTTIEEACFRIAKNSALEGKTSSYVKADNLDILMTNLNNENFDSIKNYFVSFMSAYVISSNYQKKGD